MRKLAVFVVMVFFLTGLTPQLLGQGIDGTLRGTVTDPSGAIMPGAKVTVTNEATGLSRTVEASTAGVFNVANLLIGTYSVTAEHSGFKKYVGTGLEIKANQITDFAVRMEVGSPGTTVVEVTGGGDLISTMSSQLTTSWGNREVTELPMPVLSGDAQNLAIFQVGTTTQSGGVTGWGGSVGGNRPRNNNFVLDGVDNNRIDVTGPSQPVIPDALADFTLITNQFNAEYGHSTAGQFIQTTKSGTNQLHGSLFWYLNNRRLNSLDNLDAAAIARGDLDGKPRYDRNRLGGTAGGPVMKDKFFLFGAFQYEAFYLAATPSAAVEVPTSAGFSTLNSLATTAGSGVRQNMVDILNTGTGPAAAATGSVDVINEATGLPVPVEVGVIAPSAPDYFREYQWNVNGDVNTARHRFSGRVSFDRYRSPDVPAFPLPQFVGTFPVDARSAIFTDAFTISSNVINEFRAGYRRFFLGLTLPTSLTAPPGLDVYPNFVVDQLGLNMGPTGESPQSNVINTYQLSDTLTWVKGRHNFKTGADFRWWIAPTNFLPRERGEYDWNSLDSFVKDIVPDGANGALRGVGNGLFAGNQKAFYGFFQDDMKIHPRFTLNLGIRYEWTGNARDVQTQTLNSVADLASPTRSGLAPLIFGVPKDDRNNWAPRLGFAWDLFGDQKTSLRGGFGVAHDVLFQNLVLLQLPPQLQQEMNTIAACALAAPPSWCASGTGFVAGGGLPSTFVPGTLSQADARAGTQALIVDTTAPVTYTWSLSLQRQIGREWSVELRYMGNRGLRLPAQVRRNRLLTPPDNLFLPTYFSSSDVPANVPLTQNSLEDFENAQDLPYLPDGFFGNITAFDPVGNSIYHAGSIELNRRMANLGRYGNGLFLRTGYTWSKTIDDSTNELFTSVVNPRRPQNHSNIRDERGLSALHHEHKFSLAMIYELPRYGGSSSFMNKFLNQWQVSSTFLAETGQPVTPLSFIDANGNFDAAGDRAVFNPNGQGLTTSDANSVCRDGVTGATSIAAGCASSAETVGYVAIDPTASYVAAYPGARTTSGRNILSSAGLNNWNLGIFKKTEFGENKFVEFRFQMINAFNHPQFTLSPGTIEEFLDNARDLGFDMVFVGDNPNFMKPENVFSSGRRFIQLGLKVVF